MEVAIKILDKAKAIKLLRLNCTRDTFNLIVGKNINECLPLIKELKANILSNTSKTELNKGFVSGELKLEHVASLICTIFGASIDDKTSDYIPYNAEHLQKIFAHLDKKDLKKAETYRKGYNELLEKLAKNNHPFGKLEIDQNWNIIGNNGMSLKEIEDYITNLVKNKEFDNKRSKNKDRIELNSQDLSQTNNEKIPNLYFKITNPILLKEIISGSSSKNIGRYASEKSTFLKSYFNDLDLPISSSKTAINKAINLKASFPQEIFNAFLACLFERKIVGKKQVSFNNNDFQNFNSCIEFPKENLNEDTLKKYNLLFERIHNDNSSIAKLKIDTNWNVSIKRNKVVGWIENNKKIVFFGLSIMLLLSFFIFKPSFVYSYFYINKPSKYLFEDTMYCIFNPDPEKHQILVLPFKDIDGEKKKENIGHVISRRLDSLNKADTLNIKVRFCNKFNPDINEDSYFKKIKESYNADHLIYGFYSNHDNNEDKNSEKVVLNYLTSFSQELFKIPNNYTDSSLGIFKQITLDEIGRGRLQENLDFLIYYNAMIASFKNNKFNKVLYYSNILLKYESKNKGKLYFYQGLAYGSLYKDDLSLIKLLKALEYQDINKYVVHSAIGFTYGKYNQNQRAKYHFEKAIKINSSNYTYGYLYALNKRLGFNKENVNLSQRLSEIYKDDRRFYLYWKTIANKPFINKENYIKDSIFYKEKNSWRNYSLKNPHLAELHMQIKGIQSSQILIKGNKITNKHIKTNLLKHPDSLLKDLIRIKTFMPEEIKGYTNKKGIVKFYYENFKDTIKFDLSKQNSLWPRIFAHDKYPN